MVTNRKPTGRALSMPAGLAAGGVWSIGITLLCAAVIAKLVEGEKIREYAIGYFAMGILFLSAFTGAIMAGRLVKHRIMMISMLSGLVYYAILLSMTALFFGGQYEGMLTSGLLILAGAAAAVLIGQRKERTKRKIRGVLR